MARFAGVSFSFPSLFNEFNDVTTPGEFFLVSFFLPITAVSTICHAWILLLKLLTSIPVRQKYVHGRLRSPGCLKGPFEALRQQSQLSKDR